jgi:hypothetical protein
MIEFDSYQLRMIYIQWYFFLFKGNEKLETAYGPYTYKEAMAQAEILAEHGIRDRDKG